MLLYRPDPRSSCCPHYTIRLDSAQFKPSRDQRQAINRFNKYVLGDDYVKEAARLYPKSRDEAKKRDNSFELSERVHEAEYSRLKMPPEPAHRLVVSLEEDNFTEEKFSLYKNYQQAVHKDNPAELSPQSFQRFLCSSPLRRDTMVSPQGHRRRLGSYHQCYRMDGKLVAIGILDLLPECVSSVYFLYDESIHKYMPGKLGALYEIALAMEEGYRWWYPGFYIHSCPKMRYKCSFSPQYILDPEALTWDPLDQRVLELLDKKPFVSLAMERKAVAQDTSESRSAEQLGALEDQADETQAQSDSEDDIWLFDSRMPGIPSISEIASADMDHIALKVRLNSPLFKSSDLVGWNSKTVYDRGGAKAHVAELVAAIGPDLIGSICLVLASR